MSLTPVTRNFASVTRRVFWIASFSAVTRLRVLRRQNAFASGTRKRENVRVCPALAIWYGQLYSVYTLNERTTRRFHLKCVQCEHIEPKSKEVSFNMKGIFSCVRYYRKEIFAKGRGPVGLLILKEKY